MNRRSRTLCAGSLSFFFGLAGCGSDDGGGGGNPMSCSAGCNAGFVCQGGACTLDPSALWVPTVTTGNVAPTMPDGSSWHVLGGLPDPYVCLTINGQRTCTNPQMETLTPVWNQALPAATAAAFIAGVIGEMWDSHPISDDVICAKGTLPVTTANFQSGSFGGTCPSGNFTVTIQAQ